MPEYMIVESGSVVSTQFKGRDGAFHDTEDSVVLDFVTAKNEDVAIEEVIDSATEGEFLTRNLKAYRLGKSSGLFAVIESGDSASVERQDFGGGWIGTEDAILLGIVRAGDADLAEKKVLSMRSRDVPSGREFDNVFVYELYVKKPVKVDKSKKIKSKKGKIYTRKKHSRRKKR